MEIYKILAQVAPTGSGTDSGVYDGVSSIATSDQWLNIYQVPIRTSQTLEAGNIEIQPSIADVNTVTIVGSIFISNLTGSAHSYWLRVRESSSTVGSLDKILFAGVSIGANQTELISPGLGLSAGNVIDIMCDTADSVSFSVFGIEVS